MRCFLARDVSKRRLSADVGTLARDILLAGKSTSEPKNNAMIEMPRRVESDSITDRWLKRALTKKWDASLQQGIGLYMPIVLKTLQKLRSSDNEASYFTLLNKINSSNVTWVSQNGNPIRSRQNLPIEFYHEVSNMIHRMALSKHSSTDLCALANFSINLLDGYQKLVASGEISHKQYQTKFYKNCLMVIIKSESILSLLSAFEKLPLNQAGLKVFAEVAFYYQTGQLTKVLDLLHESILSEREEILITKTQVEFFFPVLMNVLQECLMNGEEEICCKLMDKLTSHWNYELDGHCFTILKELSERLAMDKFLLTLGRLRPDSKIQKLRKEIQERKMSWSAYCESIHNSEINMFEEELQFDCSQVILSSVGPTLQNWKTFVKQNSIPTNADESLKAYFVNSILISLASQKNVGFSLAMLEFFTYDRQCSQSIIDSHRLVGLEHCSGFHALFKSISNSSSAELTAYTLYDFLQHNRALGFQFNANDFHYSIKACANSSNHQAVYYFLFQYLLMYGHTLYVKMEETYDWELPYHLEQIFEMFYTSKGDDRISKIISEARSLFLANRLQKGESVRADELSLKEIFGNEYLPVIKSNVKLSSKDHRNPLQASSRRISSYLPSVDLENAQRLSNCLTYIAAHSSPR